MMQVFAFKTVINHLTFLLTNYAFCIIAGLFNAYVGGLYLMGGDL